MIYFIRFIWYVNMIAVIVLILRQEPKLKGGINNLNRREKGFSISSLREKILIQQTSILIMSFVALTIGLAKLINI
uniref:preprotein translocase subunit G n=1 Tax=Chroothece richteriana TaxID=101928 RepID=UPI001FCD3731|nr:preprotein translocase subunit G [Chroothece richteriana]UNJ14241.1 preprotein translocase subunit G [Chroothece richteriana]